MFTKVLRLILPLYIKFFQKYRLYLYFYKNFFKNFFCSLKSYFIILILFIEHTKSAPSKKIFYKFKLQKSMCTRRYTYDIKLVHCD